MCVPLVLEYLPPRLPCFDFFMGFGRDRPGAGGLGWFAVYVLKKVEKRGTSVIGGSSLLQFLLTTSEPVIDNIFLWMCGCMKGRQKFLTLEFHHTELFTS